MNHMKSMAELLYANAIQQMEVALLGSPVAHLMDPLLAGLMQTKLVLITTAVQPLWVYNLTHSTPPPTAVLILGVTSSTPVDSVTVGESVVMVSEPQDVSLPTSIPKHLWITPTPILSSESPIPSISSSSSGLPMKSVSYPIIVVPKLKISVESYPK